MKIIIAIDGSTYSRTAVNELCRLVGKMDNVSIKIISVYSTVIPIDSADPSLEYSIELEKSYRTQAEDIAEEAAGMIRRSLPGLTPDLSTKVTMGNPPQKIVETAKEWGADLIVVGSHGRGFWKRMLLGSVSDAILHHAPCSVLVVRETMNFSEDMQME